MRCNTLFLKVGKVTSPYGNEKRIISVLLVHCDCAIYTCSTIFCATIICPLLSSRPKEDVFLHITAGPALLNDPLSSVPNVAVVERFDCNKEKINALLLWKSTFSFLSRRKNEFVKENEGNWRHTSKMLYENTWQQVPHKVGRTLLHAIG